MDIAHRDLKPENFLLQDNTKGTPLEKNVVKVVDFGFARPFEPKEKFMTMCGTPHYMAPEILIENGYDALCDIWSCGIILYVLLGGHPPFGADEEDVDDVLKEVRNGKLSFDSDA